MRGWFIVNKAHAKHQQTTNQSSLQFFLRAFILATILAKRRLTFNKTTQKCVCVTFAKWKKVNSYVSDNFLYLRFDAQKSINYNNNDRFDQNAKMRIKVLLFFNMSIFYSRIGNKTVRGKHNETQLACYDE